MKYMKILILLMLGVGNSYALEGKMHQYQEITDGVESITSVKFMPHPKRPVLALEYHDSSYRMIISPESEVLECTVFSIKDERTTTFRRRGNLLVLRSGEVGTVESVDDLPWLQSPFNLASFIVSEDRSVKFLTASVSDFLDENEKPGSVITLVAKKKGRENIELNGQEISAERVIITLTGFKSLFWKITYWYRPADGVVLKYKETRGGSGTPETVGVLIGEELIP